MSKWGIDSSTLSAIGDAVRTKSNTEELIKVRDLPEAILAIPTGGGGDIPREFTGELRYFNYNGRLDNLLTALGDYTLTGSNYAYAFYGSSLENVMLRLQQSANVSFNNTFAYSKISHIRITGTGGLIKESSSMFQSSKQLEDIEIQGGITFILENTSSSTVSHGQMFRDCYSLLYVPENLMFEAADRLRYQPSSSSNSIFYYLYSGCMNLRRIIIPCCYKSSGVSTNMFSNTFSSNTMCKDVIFDTSNGIPHTINWKNQVVDLSSYFGYTTSAPHEYVVFRYPEVRSISDYEAMEGSDDYWAIGINYSHYNHDSAVRTINSLPDTSNYGTNTIKFKKDSGKNTTGGAISNLTPEEIAVASAKGWTVSLS